MESFKGRVGNPKQRGLILLDSFGTEDAVEPDQDHGFGLRGFQLKRQGGSNRLPKCPRKFEPRNYQVALARSVFLPGCFDVYFNVRLKFKPIKNNIFLSIMISVILFGHQVR
jgi:hypothetical protein